jgi:hypothetical protein
MHFFSGNICLHYLVQLVIYVPYPNRVRNGMAVRPGILYIQRSIHATIPTGNNLIFQDLTPFAHPALCPVRVLPKLAPLGQPPSLHLLRRQHFGLVRGFLRYYEAVRLPMTVHHRITPLGFPTRPLFSLLPEATMGSPGFRAGCFRTCSGSLTAQGRNESRATDPLHFAFRPLYGVGALDFRDFTAPYRATRSPVNASPPTSRPTAHDSGPMWLATPSSHDSFIQDTLPAFTGASQRPHGRRD